MTEEQHFILCTRVGVYLPLCQSFPYYSTSDFSVFPQIQFSKFGKCGSITNISSNDDFVGSENNLNVNF